LRLQALSSRNQKKKIKLRALLFNQLKKDRGVAKLVCLVNGSQLLRNEEARSLAQLYELIIMITCVKGTTRIN